MKKYFYISLILILVVFMVYFVIISKPRRYQPKKGEYPYTILLLLPHTIDDGSWNQLGYETMLRLADEEKFRFYFHQRVNPDDVDSIVTEYSDEPALMVLAHGGEYVEVLEPIAIKFPHIKFAVVGSYIGNGRNYGSISNSSSFCYLAGVVAAMKSRSNSIAAIMGNELRHVVNQYEAFAQGARSIKPEIKTSVRYVGSWVDQPLALRNASELIKSNVDVLMINLDQVSRPIHQYAEENSIYTISVITDERKTFPQSVIAAAVTDHYQRLRNGIRLFLQGQWEGKMYNFGLTEGVTNIELQKNILNPKEMAQYEAIYADLIQKRIVVADPTE